MEIDVDLHDHMGHHPVKYCTQEINPILGKTLLKFSQSHLE